MGLRTDRVLPHIDRSLGTRDVRLQRMRAAEGFTAGCSRLGEPPEFDGIRCADCGNRAECEADHSEPHVAGAPPQTTT